MDIEEKLALIEEAVKKSCKSLREDAAYSGSWDDGGASRAEERFKAFNDGVTFALTGVTQFYGHILKQRELEQNEEYQEYLRLKEKFKE